MGGLEEIGMSLMNQDNTFVDLALIIPIYNEEGSVAKVLRSWNAELDKLAINYEIHVYNDGSRDDTAEIIETEIKANSAIILHNKPNSGHGPTILLGYQENDSRAEWLFQVDSDDEMGPEWFYKLWNIRQDHEFIVGKRYERKSSFYRRMISMMARLSVQVLFGACVYDVNCPYRLMRSATFKECFDIIPPRTFAPNVLISGWASWHNIKTIEIHIPHRSRYSGRVSLSLWKVIRESIRSFWQTFRFRALLRSRM